MRPASKVSIKPGEAQTTPLRPASPRCPSIRVKPKAKPKIHPDFNLPGRSKITGRKSTLTGLFINSITPILVPSMGEVDAALHVLGMKRDACVCAYCGGPKSEWDHFRAIVRDRKPTGFITEIANLVPSCGKCNQSKGNKLWLDWINSNARQSPRQRSIQDLAKRISRLDAYEKKWPPIKMEEDYSNILEQGDWERHLCNLERIIECLKEAEVHAEVCRQQLDRLAKEKELSRAKEKSPSLTLQAQTNPPLQR